MGERRRLGYGNARERRGAPPANSPSTRQARVAAGKPRDTGRTTHGAERAGASDRAVAAWPCLARVALLSFAAALAACDGGDKNPSPSEPPAALTVSAGTGGSLRAGGLVHVVVGSVSVEDIAAGSSGSVDVAGGSDVTLTAVPSAGYRFAGWTLSGGLACESGADANPCVLAAGSVGADATVSAAFEAGDLLVFDDAVGARWDLGIGAHDGLQAGDCMGGDSASCGNVSWAIVAAADPARGEVLEISHGDAMVDGLPAFSRVYLRSSAGQDLSGYDDGELRFDIMVASQGSGGSTPTFQIRVDCLPGCGSADHALGTVGAEGLADRRGEPAAGLDRHRQRPRHDAGPVRGRHRLGHLADRRHASWRGVPARQHRLERERRDERAAGGAGAQSRSRPGQIDGHARAQRRQRRRRDPAARPIAQLHAAHRRGRA